MSSVEEAGRLRGDVANFMSVGTRGEAGSWGATAGGMQGARRKKSSVGLNCKLGNVRVLLVLAIRATKTGVRRGLEREMCHG